MNRPSERTSDYSPPKPFAEHLFAEIGPKYSLQFGAVSHRGRVRPINEDHYAVLRQARSLQMMLSNLPPDGEQDSSAATYSLIVADGVGGAAFGEFASQLAIETALSLLGRASSWVMKFTDLKEQQLRERVDAYIEKTQQALQEFTRRDSAYAGMGTTWTSAHLMPPHAIVVHLGDSRAYLFRGNLLQQITRDHTLAEEMIRSGAPPEDVRRFHNVLTNGLGGESDAHADIALFEMRDADRILVCTDGLTDMIAESAIAEVLARVEDCQQACEDLLQLALQGGGRDNITAIVGQINCTPPSQSELDTKAS